MDAGSLKRQMVVGRSVLGVGAVVAPRAFGRLFGVDPADNPVAPYLMRLFGIRELFMAWDLHRTSDDELERTVTGTIPVDGGDAIASALAGAAGYMPRRAALLSTATAVFGTVHGVLLRSRIREEQASTAELRSL